MNPSAMAAKANKKFAQYGQQMTYVQESEHGQPDPATGLPVVERTFHDFMGMWDTVNIQELGTLIQAGDAVIWAAGNAVPEPDITDWVKVGDKAWDIITIEATRPGAVPILYKLYVRAAGSAEKYTRIGGTV